MREPQFEICFYGSHSEVICEKINGPLFQFSRKAQGIRKNTFPQPETPVFRISGDPSNLPTGSFVSFSIINTGTGDKMASLIEDEMLTVFNKGSRPLFIDSIPVPNSELPIGIEQIAPSLFVPPWNDLCVKPSGRLLSGMEFVSGNHMSNCGTAAAVLLPSSFRAIDHSTSLFFLTLFSNKRRFKSFWMVRF